MAGRPVARIARAQMRRPAETGKRQPFFTVVKKKQNERKEELLGNQNPHGNEKFLTALTLPANIDSMSPELREPARILVRLKTRFGSNLEYLPSDLLARYKQAGDVSRIALLTRIGNDAGRLNALLKKR